MSLEETGSEPPSRERQPVSPMLSQVLAALKSLRDWLSLPGPAEVPIHVARRIDLQLQRNDILVGWVQAGLVVAFALLYAVSIGLMQAHSFLPFPSEIIALANGMVYGPFWGTVITWIGAMLGAASTFALVRVLGRPFAYRFLSARHRDQIAVWSLDQGVHTLLIARLIPLIAFNLINYGAALTDISWWTFLWATGLGILPLTILLNVLGDGMLSMPAWAWLLLFALAALIWLLPRGAWRRGNRREDFNGPRR